MAKASNDMVQLNLGQITTLIVNSYRHCVKNELAFPVFNLLGQPGIGKTFCTRDAAKQLGIDIVVIPIATYPYEDVGGLPMFFDEGDGRKRLEYALAHWVPKDKDWKGLIVFDDASQATGDIQKILANIIYERSLRGVDFPKGAMFICTGNRLSDRSGVVKSFDHLLNRQCVIEVTCTVDDWLIWAMKNAVNEKVIAYIAWQKDTALSDYEKAGKMPCATPRSWVALANKVEMFEQFKMDNAIRVATYGGFVGQGRATEFIKFCEIWDKVPDPEKILKKPMSAEICKEMSLKYATALSLANRLTEKNIENGIKYASRPEFGTDLAWLMLQMATTRDDKLFGTKSFNDWAIENSAIMHGSF